MQGLANQQTFFLAEFNYLIRYHVCGKILLIFKDTFDSSYFKEQQ